MEALSGAAVDFLLVVAFVAFAAALTVLVAAFLPMKRVEVEKERELAAQNLDVPSRRALSASSPSSAQQKCSLGSPRARGTTCRLYNKYGLLLHSLQHSTAAPVTPSSPISGSAPDFARLKLIGTGGKSGPIHRAKRPINRARSRSGARLNGAGHYNHSSPVGLHPQLPCPHPSSLAVLPSTTCRSSHLQHHYLLHHLQISLLLWQ